MKRKPYKVKSQEMGRGPWYTTSFATLVEAQAYVRSHWQGADYIDGPAGFHSDYCRFVCVGFELKEIGKRRLIIEDGQCWGCEWDWLDLNAPPAIVEEPAPTPAPPAPIVYEYNERDIPF